jgi:hypothetical protein
MPKMIVTTAFKFAHGGCRVEEFSASPEPVDSTQECVDLAIEEGWAEPADASAPSRPRRAPKNKAAVTAPEAKADDDSQVQTSGQG